MSLLSKIKSYIQISKVGSISRRYLVMNAFDGVMTVLGIVIAAYFSGLRDPSWLITAGLGACVAMGISGFTGAYLVEEAEESRKLKTLEKHMITQLSSTVIGRANKFASFWAAFISGLSPALGASIILIPFFLALTGVLAMGRAMIITIGLSFVVLFILGIYLGRISKSNLLLHGLKALFAGFIVIVILFLFTLF